MKNNNLFKKFNTITGWIMFAVALVVYVLTMEKSGSFWDCGEFVPGAYKLQVVHPPGAPFFNIIGRFFTLFAKDGTGQVAIAINFLSALSTAFVSLFCFWVITFIGKNIFIKKDEDYTLPTILTIMGAGVVGSLASTFADSIWFSAVEGEVYALSIFFMTFVVWAATKWYDDESPRADMWLVLISFMIGLSTGVHLLSLLALPFVGIIIFYKKFEFSWIKAAIAFGISFFVLGFVMIGVIQGIPKILSVFEIMFVNGMGMGFNTGIYVAIAFIIAICVALVYFTHKTEKYYWNLVAVSFVVLLIGYSSYALVPIRSAANPPINMNRPTDAFSLLSYLNREQYGERPLLNGPDYSIEIRSVSEGGDIVGTEEGRINYIKDEESGTYLDFGRKQSYEYDPNVKMFFPRLGVVGDPSKVDAYRAWINPPYGIFDRQTRSMVSKFGPNELEKAEAYVKQLNEEEGKNRYRVKDIITWGNNIRFFFEYQLGYMYMRYFMWNFSGRQNDIQGTYANSDGGWIVGIPAVDDALGTLWGNPEWTQENLSPVKAENYGYNKFYAIPFILGLIGLFFLFKMNWKLGLATVVLFLTTGMFFIIYGNQPPIEPRERDYVIAGSIFTYAIYIGMAVMAIYYFLKDKINANGAMVIAFTVSLIGPFLMGFDGWNDHDRSGRTTAVDFATNYLESCEPNGIIFTQGDNDTYPLWYAQEVEGIRTDVRVVNLSLLGVDWYVNQLRYKMNDADPIKLTFEPNKLRGGERDFVQYVPNKNLDANKYYDAKEIMAFIDKDNEQFKKMYKVGYYLPTKKLSFPIDPVKAAKINLISANDSSSLPSIDLDLSKGSLMKNDLITLDIIANNINDRPIYFAVSVSPSAYLGLQKYFEQDGLTYRVVPRINPTGQPSQAPVNTAAMYNNVMNKFKWGKIDSNPKVYVDENISRMTMNLVNNFVRLAEAEIADGEKAKAIEVLDKCLTVLPVNKVPYNFFHSAMPGLYIEAGATDKGDALADKIVASAQNELNYYTRVYNEKIANVRKYSPALLEQYGRGAFTQNRDVMEQLYLLQQLSLTYKKNGNTEKANDIEVILNDYSGKLRAI